VTTGLRLRGAPLGHERRDQPDLEAQQPAAVELVGLNSLGAFGISPLRYVRQQETERAKRSDGRPTATGSGKSLVDETASALGASLGKERRN